MYSYMEKNYVLLDYEQAAAAGFRARDRLRPVGVAFRSSRAEPLIDRFLTQALRLLLLGDQRAIRQLYRETCAALRAHRLPVSDVCVSMPLNKTPQNYANAKRKEEPYEVYIAAGNSEWRPGARVRYYQARVGKRLLQPDGADYDADFYIGRLRQTCRQRLEKAFDPEVLDFLFSETDGLFDPPLDQIQPLCETHLEPITIVTDGAEGPTAGGELVLRAGEGES
jgi:DNA polymerase elongation subunit (family B)